MKPETRKIERWLMANCYRNEFAAYWWPKMRDASDADKDAVADEMRESWERVRETLVTTFEDMGQRWRKARKGILLAAERWQDITWFTRYADDLGEPEEDVFL